MTSVTIPFGQRSKDGRMVSVAEVPRGRQCGCVCPECNGPLEARKGEMRSDYFAHQPGAIDCRNGLETSIHRMAKQMISDHAGLVVPELIINESAKDEDGNLYVETEVIVDKGWQRFESINLEQTIDPKRPDVVGIHDGNTYIVEIYVTNRTQSEKTNWLREKSYYAIEVDLSKVEVTTTPDELKSIVIDDAKNKRWLSYPPVVSAKQAIKARLKDKIEIANRQLREQRRQIVGQSTQKPIPIRETIQTTTPSSLLLVREYDPRWILCESCRHIWTVPLSQAPYHLRTIRCPECGFDASCAPFIRL